MTLVIGLIGEKGSGKQTFVNFLKEILEQIATLRQAQGKLPRNDAGGLKIRQVRFSDILAQTLMIWDLPVTRINLQKLSLAMNDTFGASSLANAAKFNIEGDSSEIIILDGIRRESEMELVKNFKDRLLIYITANQNLRFERLKLRSEKVGEAGLTFEQFMAEEKSKAETEIPKLGKMADLELKNNGSLEEFRQKIKQLKLN